jgi:uncharacterized Zn finger protein
MSTEPASAQEGVAQPIKDREHFAISVPASGIAVVENRKHDDPTSYAINVSESGETTACSCPADEHYPGPCKHRRAVESEACVVLAATSEART